MVRSPSTIGPHGVVPGRGAVRGRPCAPAFTLVELLVVIAIVAVLASLLVPALRSVRGQARKLHCSSNLRSIAIEFQFFADNVSADGQGDSEALGPNRFRVNDFQDQLYRLDEFWDGNDAPTGTLTSGEALTMCPSGVRRLEKHRDFPCGRDALSPVDGISLAFNKRLYRGTIEVGGSVLLAPVAVTSVRRDVLNHPYIPLVMDVDGAAAAAAGLDPFYIAPAVSGQDDPYATNRFWLPSKRHANEANVAFVGGHVSSSRHPEDELWNWSYTASVGG